MELELPGAEPLPQKIGKYEIQGVLGKGSSGLVYKGYDPFVGREVAVKVALHLSEEPKHLGQRRESPDRAFFAEARAAGRLHHPHIVALFDAAMEVDLAYIVMEYVDGDTLAPWARKLGPRLPVDRVIEIGLCCAQALDYSHARGVMHRDIKPSNIMIARDGTPKIMDFSIAEIRDRTQKAAGNNAVGSPLYMPPEQVMRMSLTPAADLYSLGAVMYQLLTGEPPFFSPHLPGLFTAIRNQPAPELGSKRPDIGGDLPAIISKLLAKKPEERYATGRELAADLQHELDRLRDTAHSAARSSSRDNLRGLPFFETFRERELDEVLSASQIRSYPAGATIITPDEADAAFYLIIRGEAQLRVADVPRQILSRGECFGTSGLVLGVRRTVSVIASQPTLALRISPTLLDALAPESQLRFYRSFTQLLLQRLANAQPARPTP